MATINQLRRDHANMARLLYVLTLRQETLAQGERPDFHLIREVVDYILDYMTGFIKPLERLYSEHLPDRELEDDTVSRRLANEYESLRVQLNLLSTTVDMILMDAVVPMDRFADDLKAYIDAHRAYLRAEREELLPFFRENLTAEERASILKMMPETDHTNLSRLKEAYPQLYAEFKEAPPIV